MAQDPRSIPLPRPAHIDPERFETANRLHSTAIHLLRLLRLRDKESGVGPARLSALSVLVFAGPKSLKELAAIEQVKAPTMSRVISGLRRSGLACQRTDRQDRRRAVIEATARGHKVLQEARLRRVELFAERMTGFTSDDLALLQQAESRLRSILRAPVSKSGRISES